MNTFEVHAMLLSLSERGGAVAPDQWVHDLAGGSLTYRFAGSPNSFTWDAEAIAKMPDDRAAESPTARAQELLDRWDAALGVIAQSEQPTPDRVLVDHLEDRMTLVWHEPKVEMVIEAD